MRFLCALAAAGAVALAGTTSDSAAQEPLPFTAMSPADGATFSPSIGQIKFEVHTGIPEMHRVNVTVASQNVLNSQGLLASAYFSGSAVLAESDAFGGYMGNSNPLFQWYPAPPGTYYWQMWGDCSNCGTDNSSHYFRGPVRRLVIENPSVGSTPTPTPTTPGIRSSDVSTYTRAMLRKKTDGRVRSLVKECSGAGSPQVVCYLTWKIGRYRFEGTARFRHYTEARQLYWYFTFKGNKKQVGCRSCRAKRLRWR